MIRKHCRYADSIWAASSLRADMISGKNSQNSCAKLDYLIHPALMRAFMMIASQSLRDTL
jgi:hypothetical protein